MPLVATPFNGAQKRKEERNLLPSLTVPDQSMSVAEIMRRYANGLPIGGAKVPLWEEDEDFYPDVRTLDLAEIQDIIQSGHDAKEQLDQVKKRLNEKAAKLQEKQREKDIAEKAVAEYRAKNAQQKSEQDLA